MALAESVAASIAANKIFFAIGVLLSILWVSIVLLNRLDEDVFLLFSAQLRPILEHLINCRHGI
jgi:hypothetical protein